MTTNQWKKNIILFLSGQTVSMFGTFMVQYAIMWHITLTTQSGVMMTIAILCGFLPTFLLSPFAGVWADRYNRKMLIVWADAGIAIATFMLALLFLAGYEQLWLLFAVSVVRAIGSSVQTPAVAAMLPQLVPEDQLMRINGLNGSIQAFVMLLSPMAGAALLTVANMETIFFVDVATAAIAIAILFFFVKVKPHAKSTEVQKVSYFADLRQGFIYVRNNRYLMGFFTFCALFFIAAAPAAFLTPLQVTRTFGGEYWRLTSIEVAFSIGMMLGGAAMASWGGFRNRVHTMASGTLLFGLFTIGLGAVSSFWIYLVFMMLVGVTLPVFNTPATVLLQEKVEENYLGRVFGVMTMISSSMMPLGMLVFGPIADAVAIEYLLVLTGALMLLQGLLLFVNRPLVAAGEPVAPSDKQPTASSDKQPTASSDNQPGAADGSER